MKKVDVIMKCIDTLREVKRCMEVDSKRDFMIQAIGATTCEDLYDVLDKVEVLLLETDTSC